MVDYNLINSLELDNDSIDQELSDALGFAGGSAEAMASALDETVISFQAGTLLKGRIIGIVGDDVVIDVGLKSEGIIPINEWDDRSAIDPGDEIDVWLESVESDSGLVVLSKRRADRMLNWQRLVETAPERCAIKGRDMGNLMVELLWDSCV